MSIITRLPRPLHGEVLAFIGCKKVLPRGVHEMTDSPKARRIEVGGQIQIQFTDNTSCGDYWFKICMYSSSLIGGFIARGLDVSHPNPNTNGYQ